jgi:hypothetical protein
MRRSLLPPGGPESADGVISVKKRYVWSPVKLHRFGEERYAPYWRRSLIPLPPGPESADGVYVKKRYVWNPVTLERVGEERYVPVEFDRECYKVPDHFSFDYRGLRLIETDVSFDVVPILPAPAAAPDCWSVVVPGSILFWTEDAVKYWLRKKIITHKQALYFYERWEGVIDERRLEDEHQDHTGIGGMRWSVNHTDGMIDEYQIGLTTIEHKENEDLWYLHEQDGTPFHFCRYFGKDATSEARDAAVKSGLYGFLPYHVESVKADLGRFIDKVMPAPIRRNHCRCFCCEGARKHGIPLFDDGRERFMDIVESQKVVYTDYNVSAQFDRVGVKDLKWKYLHVLHARTCSCAGRSVHVRRRNTGCSSPILCLAIKLQAIRLYRVYRYLMEGERVYGCEDTIPNTMLHPEYGDSGLWSDVEDDDEVDGRETDDVSDHNAVYLKVQEKLTIQKARKVEEDDKGDAVRDAFRLMVDKEEEGKNEDDEVDGRETDDGKGAEVDGNESFVEIDEEVDGGKALDEVDVVWRMVEEENRNKKAHDKVGAGDKAHDENNGESDKVHVEKKDDEVDVI